MAEESTSSFFGENRSLFSDYYIAERLQDHKEWSADVSEPFQRALEVYRENKDLLPEMKEAQTEKEFIQPILSDVLGFEYDVQRSEKRSGRVNIPDYILFGNRSSLKDAQSHRNNRAKYYSDVLALSDAKYWKRPLDGKGIAEKDRLTNANPSFQIVNYLTVTGLDWGILTNGSQWRLYSMRSRSRIDSYFEVNLQRILEEEDEQQFKYFYHFFRAEAFREDPETGQHFLGTVFQGSIDYGTRLEGRLKELIFDDVFLTLAKGFTEFRANEARNESETEESLKEIYQGTLRLLYRLLFLLHAESRSLLPIENRDYFQYSLMKLKKDIAERVEKGLTPSSQSFDVWNDLDSLFRIIDQGDPDLNVPRYNGGLFRGDHPKNQFLGAHKIADTYLVPALELLTREPDPKTGRKRFIDYKSLNVEQLGSIYEGLLEFHLRIADEPLAVVKKRGREVYEPENEVDNPSEVIPEGALYLENDKGERKATGSYYTPHYIVEYIVEHTLGPVFDKRAKIFEELMGRLEPKYGEYSDLNNKIEEGDHSERTHNKRKQLNLEIESLENRATETLLSIKICDPAMGSGHFLKEATDKLAEKIITLLAQYPENPVTKLLNSVREDILSSLYEQDISIDADEHLKDTNLIKRMVMKRSIYGVDLNPMAVELAKLSLWLDSFTVGAPLSFLDHHLKTGNSLIGTTVKEVKHTLELDEDRQIEAFGGPFSALLTATQLMRDVAQRTDATISEVQESVARYHDYEEAVKPYKRLLDLWISRHFDNDRAIVLLRQYPDKIIKEVKGEESDLHENYVPVLEQAEAQADSKRFFHWELEFPEVFIDLKQTKWLENPGFDAVVGNPPWGANLGESELTVIKSLYKSAKSTLDSFAVMTEHAFGALKREGQIGFIVPSGWQTGKSFSEFRKLVLESSKLNELINLPYNVFPDAYVDTTILLAECNDNPIQELSDDEVYVLTFDRKEKLNEIDKNDKRGYLVKYSDWFSNNLDPNSELNFLSYYSELDLSIAQKIRSQSKPLGKWTDIQRGVTPFNPIKEKKSESYKSALNGELRRYYYDFDRNYYVLFNKSLAEYKPIRYFKGPRLILRELISRQFELQAVYTDEDFITNKSYQSILLEDDKYDLKYFLSLINSRLLSNFHIQGSAIALRDDFPKIVLDETRNLPMFNINFSATSDNERKELTHKLKKAHKKLLSDSKLEDDFFELIQTCCKSKSAIIHDFLAYLAGFIVKAFDDKLYVESALDPFKFLNKGVAFKKFSDVFSEAIKYGQQLTEEDIGTVHHDIEGLRLQPEGDKWLLKLHLKHRDPETAWADWVKEDGNIVRSEQPVYRFELLDKEARYWQQAFEVLDEFENSSTFPGGKTRTTHEKLMKTKVPVFDDSTNIQPLMELREELAEVNQKIEKTDWLIDQVVYRLYGLSEEEIEIVEGSIE